MIKNKIHRNIFLVIIILLSIILPYIVVKKFSIDVNTVISILSSIDKKVIVEAIMIDLVFIFSYSFSLYFLYKIVIEDIQPTDVIKASILSWFMFNTMPFGFITGDAAKIIYIANKYKKKISHLVVVTTLQRIVSTTIFISIFLMSMFYSYLHVREISNNAIPILVFVISLTFIAVIIFTNRNLLEKFLKSIRLIKEKHIKEILTAVEKAKLSKKNILVAALFSGIHWVSGIFIPFVFIKYFGVKVDIFLLAFAYIFYSFVDNMPAVLPSNIGIHESAMATSLILIGINKNISAAVTILTRIITVVFEIALTGILSYLIGINTIKSYLEKESKTKYFSNNR